MQKGVGEAIEEMRRASEAGVQLASIMGQTSLVLLCTLLHLPQDLRQEILEAKCDITIPVVIVLFEDIGHSFE